MRFAGSVADPVERCGIARPAQAPSASTMKSDSRAWRPGTQNCMISIAPVIATTNERREQAISPVREPERKTHENEGKRVLAVLAEVGGCGR